MPSPRAVNEKLGFFWREKTHGFFHHLQDSVSSRKIQVASWRYILACKLCLILYNSCTIGSGNRDHITRGIKVCTFHVSPTFPPIMAQRFPPELSNNKHPNYPCRTLEIICWQSCNIHKSPKRPILNNHVSSDQNPYTIPLYWLVYRDPYTGLL